MPVIDTRDLDYFRQEGHRSAIYGSFLKPLTLWSMRVVGTHSRGSLAIGFDGGAGLDFTAIEEYQTLFIGTSSGSDDVDILRIRSVSSGDSGVTGTITVDPNVVVWQDDMYLTVIHDYRLYPWYPYIDPDTEAFFKNGDIAYTDQNEDTDPVDIVEFSHRAGFIRNNAEHTFWFSAANSYATAPGATITGFTASVYPAGGTLTFNTSTGVGRFTATSLTQEYYWIKVTCTDSNGKSKATWRCVFVHDPDPDGVTYPNIDFSIDQLTGGWDRGGWVTQARFHDAATLADVPDKTFCVVWREIAFGLNRGVADTVRDDIKLFVNPRFSYTSTKTGASTSDLDVTFHAGVIVNGSPATDGTNLGLALSVNGGTAQFPTANTADGRITLTGTFTGVTLSGTIDAEDLGETRVITSRTYQVAKVITEVADWPSVYYAFPQPLIVGYVRKENLTQSLAPATGGHGQDTIDITTIDDLLRNQFMFSISLASRPDGQVSKWYQHHKDLTIGRAAWHIWNWHSTLPAVANIYGLTNNTDGRAYAEFENGSLYTMPDEMARNHGIRAHVVCNKHGDIKLVADVQLYTDGERSGLVITLDVSDDDKSGEFGLLRNPEDRVAFVYGSGLVFNNTFSADASGTQQPDVEPYCATAPGILPSGEGEGTINLERQVIRSQLHINELVGRVWAQANNRYPEMRIKFHGDYLPLIDFDLEEFWQIDVGLTDTIKSVALADQNIIPRSVTCNVNVAGGTVLLHASFEPEEDGPIGEDAICLTDLPETGGVPPVDDPPIMLLPGTMVTGSLGTSVYRLPEGSSSWDQLNSDPVHDLREDPFWGQKQGTSSPSQAILFECGVGFLRRSVNGGDNWSNLLTAISHPPNDHGDDPAPLASTVTYSVIDGSRIVPDTHGFLVIWQNGSSAWRSWFLKTTDDGVTWFWKTIGAAASGDITSFSDQEIDPSTGISLNIVMTTSCLIAADSTGDLHLVSVDGSQIITTEDTLTVGTIKAGAKQTASRFMVVTKGGSSDPILRIIDLTACTSIAITDSDQTEFPTIVASHLLVCPLTASAGLYIGNNNELPNRDFRAIRYDIVTNNIVFAGTHSFWVDDSPVAFSRRLFGVVPMDSSTGIVLRSEEDIVSGLPGDGYMYAQALTDTPGSGTPVVLDNSSGAKVNLGSNSNQAKIIKLRTGVAVAIWDSITGGSRIVAMSLSGSAITTGTPHTYAAGNPTITRINDNVIQVVSGDKTETLSIDDSLDITEDDNLIDWFGGAVSIQSVGLLDNSVIPAISFVVFRDSNTAISFFDVDVAAGAGVSNKAIGLSLGRGVGLNAWITYSDDTLLRLVEITLATMAIEQDVSLGTGSIANIDSQTWLAYPIVRWFNDDYVQIYGRMDNPQSLGSPSHLIYTTNGGGAYLLNESGFGADHVGAMFEDAGNNLYVIRNTPTSPQLYEGIITGSLTLTSTLTLTSDVKPHGIDIDWNDLALIVVSGSGDAILVVVSPSPYTSWTDLTSDHGDASTTGLESVEVL